MKKIFSILLVMLMFNITVCPVFAESTKAKEINLEYQQVDKSSNINIKTLDKNSFKIKKYNKKFKKHLDKFNYELSKSNLVICSKYAKSNCYPMVDNFDMNNPSIIKINLLNGDYAIINENIKSFDEKLKYAAEYDVNGELIGIIEINTIKNENKEILLSFAEYRTTDKDKIKLLKENIKQLQEDREKLGVKLKEKFKKENQEFQKFDAKRTEYIKQLKEYDKNSQEYKKTIREYINIYLELKDHYKNLKLKHVMFVDIKQKGKKIKYNQFIYKFKGEKDYDLICWQNNNEIYVDEENQNLIVELKNFQVPEAQTSKKENYKKIITNIDNISAIILGTPMIITAFIIFGPFLYKTSKDKKRNRAAEQLQREGNELQRYK